jgi:hypothetical protein
VIEKENLISITPFKESRKALSDEEYTNLSPNDIHHLIAGYTDKMTLQELERSDWGEVSSDTSSVIRKSHELRRKPLKDLGVEDLRLLISQQIGLPYLVPLAVKILQANPLISGDFFPGDLLKSALKVNVQFWKERKDLYQDLLMTVSTMSNIPEEISKNVDDFKSFKIEER